jgi:tetratricopeptide (TPR) repeat protein
MRSSPNARILLVLAITIASASSASVLPPQPYDATAESLYVAGAYDSLLAFATRGVEDAAARGDSLRLGRMLVHRGRGLLLVRRPGAREDFDRAIALAENAGDSLGWATALGFRSLVSGFTGRFDESIRLNEQRNEIARAIGSTRNLGWGHMLIGFACLNQGDLERAEREYRQAVSVFGASGQPRDRLEALIGLGRVHYSAGRVVEARTAYRDALDIARELGDRRQEADCWNNLGGVEMNSGDLSLAARCFRRAYDLKRADGSYDVASPASNVALANTLIGHYAAAESVLIDAVQAARGSGFELIYSDIYENLGRLRFAQGRPRGAAVYFRRAMARGDTADATDRLEAVAGLAEALVAQDSAATALEVLEAHARGAFASRPSIARGDVLIVWSRCLRAAGEPARAIPPATTAYEDARSRDDPTSALLAALEICAARRSLGDPVGAHAWFDRARELFTESATRSGEFEWREAYRASLAPRLVENAAILLEWPPGAPRGERERRLFDFLQEIRARTLMERITDPRRADGPGGVAAMVTAEQLQEDVLRPGECLLDISVARGRIFVFAVTRDSLRLAVVHDPDGALERRARRYQGLAGAPGRPGAPPPAAPVELIAGVADILTAAASIIVVADGWASSLPLAAFAIGDGGPLIERCEMSVVPAASLLYDLRVRPPGAPSGGMLALAPAGASLPGAAREVRVLASRYRDVQAVDTALTIDALAELARERAVIHVASHVEVNGERPWHSGIQMSADTRGADYLRAAEIARANLSDRLIVLSSCESGLGRATQGEGVLGITTAFLAAGARTVVATLWKVDDRATSDLMLAFYSGMARGMTAGEALRAAQLSVRRHRPEPFYWAGFVVVGDPGATPALTPRGGTRILMVSLAFGILVLAGAGAVLIRRRSAPSL